MLHLSQQPVIPWAVQRIFIAIVMFLYPCVTCRGYLSRADFKLCSVHSLQAMLERQDLKDYNISEALGMLNNRAFEWLTCIMVDDKPYSG